MVGPGGRARTALATAQGLLRAAGGADNTSVARAIGGVDISPISLRASARTKIATARRSPRPIASKPLLDYSGAHDEIHAHRIRIRHVRGS